MMHLNGMVWRLWHSRSLELCTCFYELRIMDIIRSMNILNPILSQRASFLHSYLPMLHLSYKCDKQCADYAARVMPHLLNINQKCQDTTGIRRRHTIRAFQHSLIWQAFMDQALWTNQVFRISTISIQAIGTISQSASISGPNQPPNSILEQPTCEMVC